MELLHGFTQGSYTELLCGILHRGATRNFYAGFYTGELPRNFYAGFYTGELARML
ncbi:MAG: hypothetical protein K0R57_3554 [Paenibacillaceae bacterium]|jgi:hypothetical protein|nr:hypothetical protein [Paenibacillaceae bacterium]